MSKKTRYIAISLFIMDKKKCRGRKLQANELTDMTFVKEKNPQGIRTVL